MFRSYNGKRIRMRKENEGRMGFLKVSHVRWVVLLQQKEWVQSFLESTSRVLDIDVRIK